ncbi:hypothetical protein TVAG_000140 [Trichomonas vaginalis G3]|uniref:MatE family protein n=1 Tax=Trichomonas vaginalis (strain ATCC PRA-98 / G3) TaxID=412133 RepID=A2FFX5_TRIV3|nr:multidrug resistance protein YPNP-related family [Trichomonas vaginalis G3]EAX96185.1 hypothetical protein TVAG_000140 [Trichomonas vaginalis G3]KAI5506305.1 multidrug resistance protein YPNP-related family [Trichomonas vaginalis G3]|eukprot:XP_001309115.1 hypothetical protein [Trichomonas vaginalis G3]
MISKTENKSDEHYRLGGRPPLTTILVLAFGAIMSQVSSALFGIVDSMWVSKALGTKALAAVSTYSPFDYIGRAFAFFLTVSGASKISALLGEGKGEETSQVICDILRVELILAVFIPCSMLPWVKKAAAWFGASKDVVDLEFHFISVTLGFQITTGTFYAIGGFLQGEGRSIAFGIANVISCLLNMLLLNPLLLYYTNLSVAGSAIATIMADGLPAIVLFIMYFTGRFSVKPKFSQFFKKFSPHTFPALRVGLSALIAYLSMSIPGIMIQRFIGSSAQSVFEYNCVISGNTVSYRVALIIVAVTIALNAGYLPCASYAYASKNYKRWLRLTIHQCWLNFAWGSLCATIIVTIPVHISMMFVKDKTELYYASTMLFNGCCGFFIGWLRNNSQSILQSMQKGPFASILSLFTQMISLVACSVGLSLTNKHNAPRIEFAYPLSFLIGGVICIVALIFPIGKLYKEVNGKGSQRYTAIRTPLEMSLDTDAAT